MSSAQQIHHPLVAHHVTELRDRDTPSPIFRRRVQQLTYLLAYEATRDLALEPAVVQTPLAECEGRRLAGRIAILPILRAGLGMEDAVLDLIPPAEVWHLGVYRDEQTLEPVEYYHKLPADDPPGVAFILDPMLATGGSATAAANALKRWGVTDIRLLSLIAAPEGIENLARAHGDVRVFVAVIDRCLNGAGFIVPGLGDAGDRIFNTS